MTEKNHFNVGIIPVIERECAKIKATKPDCDICGKKDCNIVGALLDLEGDNPPCFCPNCAPGNLKKTVFYKLCTNCMKTNEHWQERILQKYVYN